MKDSLSPTTRKFAAVGLLVVAVLALLSLIVLPLAELHAAREAEIADASRQIERYRQVLARGPALKARLEQLREDPARRRVFLTADSPALAGARLESRLKSIVQASGGTLRSTRMQPQAGDGPERVRVTVDFKADPRALLTIIGKIEAAVPWLIADNVHIRSEPQRNNQPPAVTARLDVDVFVRRTKP